MKLKTILTVAAVAIAGFAIYGYQKASKMKAIFDAMTIKPHSLPKNIKIGLKEISFNIDILLSNPTANDFSVSGYVATLKKVNVFFKNEYIGFANVEIDEISVPSRDTLVLHDIPIKIPTATILDIIPNLTNLNINDLSFTGTIEVLGNNYEIGA